MNRKVDTIELPNGLRSLTTQELAQVAQELREELIDSVADSGGHFASSLGVTELSVALHALFHTPQDRLVWDVGHQGYVHKMLTGRRDRLKTIRQKGGISGFLKREESEYDCFGAGHAGTSISAAVGMSAALQNNPERYVVSVIGDGAMTCGMAFEALNHAGDLGLKNFIVILNDNEMSIAPNVGAISWLFSSAVTSGPSTQARKKLKNLYSRGYVPELVYKALDRAEEATQSFFASPAMLFESFGFRYIGPIDGHNMEDLVKALRHAKEQDVPVLIHAHTVKGKGYEPAENNPVKWHGVSPFDRRKGVFLGKKKSEKPAPPSYTAVFADELIELAKEDPKVMAITAAMPDGTGLSKFQAELPEQYFDVGICEQHAVTLAAGMACEGLKPVCAIYSTFLQRAFDQVLHDVCIQKLPVVFAMDRGGLVGNDGETHQGVFDISYLRTIPNITLMAPRDENMLRHMLRTSLNHNGPIALRYPRGAGVGLEKAAESTVLPIGKGEVLERGSSVLLIAYGPVVYHALEAASRLYKDHGISCTVIDARFAKPLDKELFQKELANHEYVFTVEDHALLGGFGSALLEFAAENRLEIASRFERLGARDAFTPHASQAEQYVWHGIDSISIYQQVLRRVAPRKMAALA